MADTQNSGVSTGKLDGRCSNCIFLGCPCAGAGVCGCACHGSLREEFETHWEKRRLASRADESYIESNVQTAWEWFRMGINFVNRASTPESAGKLDGHDICPFCRKPVQDHVIGTCDLLDIPHFYDDGKPIGRKKHRHGCQNFQPRAATPKPEGDACPDNVRFLNHWLHKLLDETKKYSIKCESGLDCKSGITCRIHRIEAIITRHIQLSNCPHERIEPEGDASTKP